MRGFFFGGGSFGFLPEANLNSFEQRSVATSFAWFVPYACDSKQLKQRWLPSVRSVARWGGKGGDGVLKKNLFGGHIG